MRRFWWAVGGLAGGLLLGCPKPSAGPADASALAAPAAPQEPPLRALETPPSLPNVVLGPARVFAAQVKATPDEGLAQRMARALRAQGVTAHVQRADLGERGIWFRVLLGAWPRREELDAALPAILARAEVAAPLDSLPDGGGVAFVPVDVPQPHTLPAALESELIRRAAAAAKPLSVWLVTQEPPLSALVLDDATHKVTALAADGTERGTWVLPDPTCEGCQAGATQWVSVSNHTGTAEPEWLLMVGPEDARSVLWVGVAGAVARVLASVPAHVKVGNVLTTSEATLRNLDSDADVELLFSGARVTLGPDGSACDAAPLHGAVDVEHGAPKTMDRALHAANGVARKQGGGEEMRAFWAGTLATAPEAALDAVLAYLAQAPDDAQMFGALVERAEAWGKDGRKGLQFRALVGLVNVHGQWRVGLAPRLTELLPSVVAFAKGGPRAACAWPLLTAAQAQKMRPDAREALNALHRRPDPLRLSHDEMAALMVAFEKGSPPAQAVDVLVETLDGTEFLLRSREALATRRASAVQQDRSNPVRQDNPARDARAAERP